MYRILCLIFCALFINGHAHARESLPLDTGYTEISLVSGHDTVTPGERFTVALKMKFEGNWYTYWRNAGDSGERVRIIWDLPEGINAGPIQWPAPKIKKVGPIVSYALDGEVWLPIDITIDEGVDLGRATTLRAHAYFLVCERAPVSPQHLAMDGTTGHLRVLTPPLLQKMERRLLFQFRRIHLSILEL